MDHRGDDSSLWCRTVHRFLMWITESEATQMSTGEHCSGSFIELPVQSR